MVKAAGVLGSTTLKQDFEMELQSATSARFSSELRNDSRMINVSPGRLFHRLPHGLMLNLIAVISWD